MLNFKLLFVIQLFLLLEVFHRILPLRSDITEDRRTDFSRNRTADTESPVIRIRLGLSCGSFSGVYNPKFNLIVFDPNSQKFFTKKTISSFCSSKNHPTELIAINERCLVFEQCFISMLFRVKSSIMARVRYLLKLDAFSATESFCALSK